MLEWTAKAKIILRVSDYVGRGLARERIIDLIRTQEDTFGGRLRVWPSIGDPHAVEVETAILHHEVIAILVRRIAVALDAALDLDASHRERS